MNHPSSTNDPKIKPVQVACAVCMKEIPSSEAIVAEAKDYVAHFCGPDCYEKWQQQANRTPNQKPA